MKVNLSAYEYDSLKKEIERKNVKAYEVGENGSNGHAAHYVVV